MTQWFRLYESVLDDPKVQRLSGERFKFWINLLCLACRRDGEIGTLSEIAFSLRKSEKETDGLVTIFEQGGLLEKTEFSWKPHNWSSRQYKSDGSAERMRRHRDRHRNGASDVTVTPSDTEQIQNRADTEQKESERATRSGSRLPEDWQPSAEDRAFAGDFDIDVEATASVFRDYWHGVAGAKGRKADWAGTWRNWIRREVESRKQRPSVSTKPNGSSGSAPTVPSDGSEWEARLRSYRPGGFWSQMWGERPEDIPEGRTPTQIPPTVLAAWRASA